MYTYKWKLGVSVRVVGLHEWERRWEKRREFWLKISAAQIMFDEMSARIAEEMKHLSIKEVSDPCPSRF